MGDLIALIFLFFSAFWGSVFLAAVVKRFSRKLEAPPDNPLIEALREDTHELETRLARVEEELRFFRELREPDPSARLRSPDANDS